MFEIKDFPGRQAGEQMELFVRSHPLYLLWRLLLPLLLLGVNLGLVVAITRLFSVDLAGTLLLGVVLAFPALLWLAWRFSLWYYDYFIVTNVRVLDFVKKPFIYERRNEAQLSRVQDIQVVMPNPIAVLLNFGHVVVQTAGMAGQISFRYAGHPDWLRARLLNLVAQAHGPSVPQGPVDQLVGAMRRSLDALQPGAGGAPAEPAVTANGTAPAQPRKRTLRDFVLFPPASGTNPMTWRKHWWILVGKIFLPVVAMGVALAAFVLIPAPVVRIIALFMIVLGVFFLLWRTADWYNDVYIITDERIVDVEKVPFLSEDMREARLMMIQDVNYVQPNFIARLLGFGNVVIETAGRTGSFTFENVPNPREVQRQIFARWEQARQPQRAPERAQAAQDFMQLLDQYLAVKQKQP